MMQRSPRTHSAVGLGPVQKGAGSGAQPPGRTAAPALLAAPSAQKQCKRLIFCASLFNSVRILYPRLEDLCHKVILVFFRSRTISHNVAPDFSVVVAVCF